MSDNVIKDRLYVSWVFGIKGYCFPNVRLNIVDIWLITFGLACILCFAICFGLTLATVVGIAYGYNYSMAEFITFTRSDVTVFMRRGQFYDKPKMRRSGGAEDMFAPNASTDYEDQKPPEESKPLADTWLKTQDTRKYAEILTRYNPPKKAEVLESEVQVPRTDRETPIQLPSTEHHLKPTMNAPIISIVPNPLMPTVSWRSGSSKIMMRNFQPLQDHTVINNHGGRPETLFPTRSTGPQSISIFSHNQPKQNILVHDDVHGSYVPMRVWGTTVGAVIPEDPDDVDENNIVYKPV